MTNITAQENLLLAMAKGDSAQTFTHAIFTGHLAGQFCSALQIIASAA